MLKSKNVVLGIASSISAYKSLELVRILRKKGANVLVIMSKNATKLVDAAEFEKVSGNEVAVEQFAPGVDFKGYLKKDKPMRHISLADMADIFLICPCTANTIGKIANGIADTLLCSSVMATNAPVVICPAMNVKMWHNPIMQENVRKLKKIGYEFVEPEKGILACGYEGIGRLANFNRVVEMVEHVLRRRNDLKGNKVLVTGGATAEEIDPVRVITNKSSGKTGVYLAEEAAKRGAEVTLIRGRTSLEPKYFGIKDVKVSSASEMSREVRKSAKSSDIVIHAAAVSDFAINNSSDRKIKSGQELHLELTPTTKILENIKKVKKSIFLVGFKAEYRVSRKELVERAYKLLKSADADLIVANDVGRKGRGFDVDTNEVFIVDKRKCVKRIGVAGKRAIAGMILDEILKRMS
jgi:phosphopantothenoylcysteine decarboxylase/phosphopantothenate--cysteine ligase